MRFQSAITGVNRFIIPDNKIPEAHNHLAPHLMSQIKFDFFIKYIAKKVRKKYSPFQPIGHRLLEVKYIRNKMHSILYLH